MRGGAPIIAGTGIRVVDIVRYRDLYKDDDPVARTIEALPHISEAQINAALKFYKGHRDEIDRYMEAEDRLADELRSSQRSI